MKASFEVLFTLYGLYLATKGLNAWREQLVGESEFKLAKRLQLNLLKYQRALLSARFPVIYKHEYPDQVELGNVDGMTYQELQYIKSVHVYESRWGQVSTTRVEFDADLLEAETFWPGLINTKSLYELEFDLQKSIECFLDILNPKMPDGSKEFANKFLQEKGELHFGEVGKSDDYEKNVREAVDDIFKSLQHKIEDKRNVFINPIEDISNLTAWIWSKVKSYSK